jgi:hypothetical protein
MRRFTARFASAATSSRPRGFCPRRFADTANLSEYDFSDMVPMRFELSRKDKSVSLRLPERLLDEVRAAAEAGNMPCRALHPDHDRARTFGAQIAAIPEWKSRPLMLHCSNFVMNISQCFSSSKLRNYRNILSNMRIHR